MHSKPHFIPFWSSISFTNLTSLCSSYLESLHDLIMVWLVVIFFVVIMISYFSAMNSSKSTHLMPDSMVLESTWTVVPMLILVSIAFPSIHLLCMQDSLCFIPSTSIKITSNQWNWQSTMLDDSWDHLLDADKVENVGSYEVPLLLSSDSYARMLLSSTDVLHSLGVPSLGIKLDSMPGRINSTVVEMTTKGLFSGSCYELCGSGHSVMPIYTLVV